MVAGTVSVAGYCNFPEVRILADTNRRLQCTGAMMAACEVVQFALDATRESSVVGNIVSLLLLDKANRAHFRRRVLFMAVAYLSMCVV